MISFQYCITFRTDSSSLRVASSLHITLCNPISACGRRFARSISFHKCICPRPYWLKRQPQRLFVHLWWRLHKPQKVRADHALRLGVPRLDNAWLRDFRRTAMGEIQDNFCTLNMSDLYFLHHINKHMGREVFFLQWFYSIFIFFSILLTVFLFLFTKQFLYW